MAEQKENPKCERCGKEGPVNTYNPNTPGYPTKKVNLCDECAAKDSKAIFIGSPTSDKAVDVPNIAPAVPGDPNAVETIEFGPKTTELNVAPVAPVQDLGPVPPDALRQRLAAQEKDHDALIGQRTKMQGKLNEISNIIMAKRGAIATLRDLLGNAKS